MTKAQTIDASDEDAVLARAQEIQTERAAKAQADLVEAFAPVVALVDSEAFRDVREQAKHLAEAPGLPRQLATTFDTLATFLHGIPAQVPFNARPAA